MKSMIIAAAAALAMTAAGSAFAAEGEDMLKANGCLNCHDMNTKKVGPAFADVAKKAPAKGKERDAYEAKLVEKVAGGKGHPAVKAKQEDVAKMVHAIVDK
jgi:cytochrome c